MSLTAKGSGNMQQMNCGFQSEPDQWPMRYAMNAEFGGMSARVP